MEINPATLQMAINFYTKKLIDHNKFFLVTPAMLVKLNRQAEALRLQQKSRESHPVWDLLVTVEGHGQNPTLFEVLLNPVT